ncbi:MAG: pentapeptide repeat-containing protein [Maritimibacter sp.]|nr:pentapeptide repeat-containing protein [Maritimibacter sp.]
MSGLDPAKDFRHTNLRGLNFCGADLRGYDFTGADLRDTAVSLSTLIDETTILQDADIRWVREEDLQIVTLMQSVQSARTSAERRHQLVRIEENFGRSEHVLQFVVNAANDQKDIDAFIDYVAFLPENAPQRIVGQMADLGARLLRREGNRARARTRRSSTQGFTVARVVERLEETPRTDTLANAWLRELALLNDASDTGRELRGFAVGLDLGDLANALDQLVRR